MDIADEVNRNAQYQAMCSIDAGELSAYFKQQDGEARSYCSKSSSEVAQQIKAGAKIGGGLLAKFVKGSGEFSRSEFEKWQREECSAFERNSLLTTHDYNRWYRENCSQLDKSDYRTSYRFQLHKVSGFREQLRAWESCMKGDKHTTILSCWFDPDVDEDYARLTVYWWTLPTKSAEILRFEVLGGEPVRSSDWPMSNWMANSEAFQKTKPCLSLLVRRHRKNRRWINGVSGWGDRDIAVA